MFDLEKLTEAGDALKNMFKTKEEKLKQEQEKFKEAKKEYETETTQEQKDIASIEDYPGQTKTGEEVIKAEAEQKESEADLEKRIAKINKVLSSFGGDVYKSPDIVSKDLVDINIKPLDLSNVTSKEYLAPYYQTSGSQKDRVALLYENLRKYNLI